MCVYVSLRILTLMFGSSLRLDAEYYIRKQIIPPLSRVFSLMGVGEFDLFEKGYSCN